MVYEKPEMIIVNLEDDVVCTSIPTGELILNNNNGGNGDNIDW